MIITSVTDEGKEQHTQRQADDGWRGRGGQGGVLSLIKQWLISGEGTARSGLWEHESDR